RCYFQAVGFLDVLAEAERNLSKSRSVEVFLTFRRLVDSTPFLIAPTPVETEVLRFQPVFFEDDHVVAAAIAAKAEFLITLDKPLQRRVRQAELALTAISPGDFLQQVLPEHVDYHQIR